MGASRRGVWLALAGMIGAGTAAQGVELTDGSPHFGFGANAVAGTQGGRTVLVGISYPPYAFGKSSIRITVPKDLAVVSGELVRETLPSVDTLGHRWFIELGGRQPGTYTITGSLSMRCKDHVDEAEWELPVVIDERGITVGLCERKRFERVDESGRYRYGGRVLVPIDGPEQFGEADIRRHGTKPRPLETPDGLCPACALRSPTTVGCLVIVDREGRVMWAKAVHEDLDVTVREAAEAAVRTWTFAPGRVGTLIINDWTGVDVVVR